MIHLIVKEPFGDHAKGDRITDQAAIAEIRAGENVHHVIPIQAEDEPEVEVEQQSARTPPAKAQPAPAEPVADTPVAE